MRAVRALQKRVARIEAASVPQPSPFGLVYGSFDAFVESEVLPGVANGSLDHTDMIDVVAALRAWEHDGTWHRARAK